MQRAHTIFLLGFLLSGVDPASAEQPKLKNYDLTVSVADGVSPALTKAKVEQILKDASDLLQQSDNNCRVGFTFAGFVPYPASAPTSVDDAKSLEAVHNVPAEVKVVQSINFCAQGPDSGLMGCSWRAKRRPRTMIVTTQMMIFAGAEHILWAHEFGHVTGLLHRSNDQDALMSPCGLDVINRLVTKNECDHFKAGRPKRYPPGIGLQCSRQ